MGIAYNPRIVTDGLVLCLDAANPKSYPGSGTTWTDLSGNGTNGTLISSPTFDDDGKGCFLFNGTNYVTLTDSYHLLSTMTISIWFKPTNTISDGANQSGRLWGKGGNFEQRWDGGAVSGKFTVDIGGTANLTSFTASWLNTVWYNVVFVIDASSSSLYVQSFLNATGTRGTFTDQTSGMQIARSAGGGGVPFSGKISNFHVYNRALSGNEVLQNFNALRGRFGI